MLYQRNVALIYASLGIAINIILGTIVSLFKIPLLFLDTIGTVFVAVLFGPWWGAATGMLTNVIQGMLTNPKDIPFFIVNVAIALIVGYVARRFDFSKWSTAAGTGLILSIVAPLIGTPIAVAIYGGLTGGGTDWLVLWLRSSGESIFASTFSRALREISLIRLVPVFL